MTKKKQHNNQTRQLNPIQYIKLKARTLPIYKCYINSNWMEKGLANIVVSRQHPDGNFTSGIYLVDVFCLGLKLTYVKFNGSPENLNDILESYMPVKDGKITLMEVDYTLAHNIIYGAIAFAKEYGYKPHKDFSFTEYILEPDDENIELIEIDFGVDGKPVLIERFEEYEGAPKRLSKINNNDEKETI